MPFNGSGTYNRSNGEYTGATVWAQDNTNGYKIVDTRHDVHDQDIATALSLCLTKDGQQSPTANLPMAGYKHTNVAAATARTDYARHSQVQDSSALYAAGGGSSNAYTLTLSPAITAYAAGQRFFFFANHANSGAATLNVNGVGAVAIKKNNGTSGGADLVAFDIQQYDLIEVVYNGTSFFLAGNFEHVRPGTTNTFDLGNADFAYKQMFARKLSGDTGQNFAMAKADGSSMWTFDVSTGDLVQSASGRDFVVSLDTTGFVGPVQTGISAAGTSVSDATQLTKMHSVVSSASTSQGVKLSNAWRAGSLVTVFNASANTIEVYAEVGSSINGAGSVSLVAGTGLIALRVSSSIWYRVGYSPV